jgi:hypothetical protein
VSGLSEQCRWNVGDSLNPEQCEEPAQGQVLHANPGFYKKTSTPACSMHSGTLTESRSVRLTRSKSDKIVGYSYNAPDGRRFDIRREDLFDPSSAYGWTVCEWREDRWGGSWEVLDTWPRLKNVRAQLATITQPEPEEYR